MASISNNSNIPLGVGETFNGLYEQLSAGVESIQINIKSDQSGVFRVFFAITPTVLLYEKSYTYLAGEFFFISVPKIATYFRCNYTNGAIPQGVFQLRTTFNSYLLVDEPATGTGAVVQVSNFPATQPISGSISVSNFPATQIASIVHLDFDTNMATVSDSTLPWIQPVNGEQGWQYLNTTIGPSQIYYYTNSGLLIPGTQESPITLGSILSQYFVGNMKVLADTDALPIVAIYTQPQGSGDFNPAYRSRKTYRPLGTLSKGANYYFHWGADANILTEYERQTLTLSGSDGPCDPAEIVLFMSINGDSLAPVNTVNLTLKHAGFTTATDTRQVNFDNSKQKNLYSQVENLTFIGNDVSVSVSNFPATQTIAGTVNANCYGSSNGVLFHHLKTTVGGELITHSQVFNSSGTAITSTTSGTIQALDVCVSNFPATQPVSISGTIPVENATGGALVISKGTPAPFSVYTGAIAAVGVYGSVDLNGYASFDLLIYQPGGSVSLSGSLYIMVSNDGVNWFINQSYSVFINTNASDKRYMTTYPSLNCRYVAVSAENPFGGTGLTTTNSVITLSAKK